MAGPSIELQGLLLNMGAPELYVAQFWLSNQALLKRMSVTD